MGRTGPRPSSECASFERRKCGDFVPLLEGTSTRACCAADRGTLVSGVLVSEPWWRSGAISAALHPHWRSHAQATSGDVQSGPGSTPYRERPHRFSAQLPILFGPDRAKPRGLSASSLFACDASLQELRAAGAIHSRSRLVSSFQTPSRAFKCVRGARSSSRATRVVISPSRGLAA